jgi:hypothetical protein
MSKEVAKNSQIIPTLLGNIIITSRLVYEYDVEDMCRAGSESQCRALQMQNVGNMLVAQPSWPKDMIPTAFKSDLSA